MTAVAAPRLVAPHGGTLVDRTGERPAGLDALERVTLTPREVSDLDMIASGALSPLEGFMGREDHAAVLEEMRLASGLPWALPVCLAVPAAPAGDRVALAAPGGTPLAVLDVEDVYAYDRRREAELCFGTADPAHPGVARVLARHGRYLAGRVTVFARPRLPVPALALDPLDTRAAFVARGWRRVVGFQTRNPMHRAHEYVTKVALELADGLLVHPLIGETKADDLPPDVRIACCRALLDGYYPAERVLLAAFPAAMRYAGPREAVWHALCRRNYGCSHFIVGRDHAGVGGWYGADAAREAFERFAPGELGIEPIFFGDAFWCRACGSIASARTCPHGDDRRASLSGTRVRELLRAGLTPPAHLTRPEVAAILGRR